MNLRSLLALIEKENDANYYRVKINGRYVKDIPLSELLRLADIPVCRFHNDMIFVDDHTPMDVFEIELFAGIRGLIDEVHSIQE